MYLMKIGAYLCFAVGVVLVVLAFVVPAAAAGLILGAIACIGADTINL